MYVCNWDIRGQRSATIHATYEDAVGHAYEVVHYDWGADLPDPDTGLNVKDMHEVLDRYLGSRSGDTVFIEEAQQP